MKKPRKGVTNLLSGAFVGGFFTTLFVTIMMLTSVINEQTRAEWDRKHLLKETKSAPTIEKGASWLAGLAFAALVGTTLGATFVAVLGFPGGRRWESVVFLLWGVLTGAAFGLVLGMLIVEGMVYWNLTELGEDFVALSRVIALTFGGCVGACNGLFFAIGVRRVMCYLLGEDSYE